MNKLAIAIGICLTILSAAMALASPAAQPDAGSISVSNTKPAANYLQISASTFKSSITANEPIILDISIKNPDSRQHGMVSQGPVDRDFNVRVSDGQGQPTLLTRYGKGEVGLILPTGSVTPRQQHKNAVITFDPGEERHFYVWVNRLYDMTVSGDYTVEVTLYLDGRDWHGQHKKGGKVLTAETSVTVKYIQDEEVAQGQIKAAASSP